MIIAGAASLHILQSRQQVVYTKSMILQASFIIFQDAIFRYKNNPCRFLKKIS